MKMWYINKFDFMFEGAMVHHVSAYKSGYDYAVKENGKWRLKPTHTENTLTRAQGYRYWFKHFSGRRLATLPSELQEAILNG